MTDKLAKPILEFVNSTQHTISLKWTVNKDEQNKTLENLTYKVEMDDPLYKKITKYWGRNNKITIEGLAPQQNYTLRVAAVYKSGEVIWSDNLIAATRLSPRWTHIMFKAIETSNQKELESFLSSRSCAIHTVNKYGETPIIQAARLGNFNSIKMLLSFGSDPNSEMYPSLQTPLMAASFSGHKEVIDVLISHGANWQKKDICGRNALHYAISNSQTEIMEMAIEGGCDVNSRDNYHWTPLMRAVILGANNEVLAKLLSYGADIELRDENNLTCLDLSRLYKHENIIFLVMKRDEDEIQDISEKSSSLPSEF